MKPIVEMYLDALTPISFKSTPQYQSLDLAASSNITLGTDTVHLYTHFFESDPAMGTNVETVPISILNSLPTSNSSAPFSYLALGPSSSLLRSLYNTGKISSRSFGLYVGEVAFPSTSSSLNSISDVPWTANGSVTFGGYDSARLKNPVGSFQLQQPPNGLNAFKVSVADVRLISDSDTDLPDTSLLKASPDKANATFGAYVSTSSIPIVIPSQVLDNLKDRTKDLSTTTNVTISFILNTASGPQPFQVFTTPASIETSFAAPSDGSAPFTLGLPFLSSNYLAVDYDAGSFYLAPAVPSAPFIAQTTLCPQTTPKPYGKPNVHSFSKQGLIGAVLGGSIGVIAALTLSYCFIGRWLRRRKREKLYGGKGKEIELDEEEMTGLTEHRLRFWRKR